MRRKTNLRVKLPPLAITPYKTLAGAGAPGHQLSTAENMPPEAHARRMAGLYKAWQERAKQYHEKRTMTKSRLHTKEKRVRIKLRETVAKEQREIQELARKNADAVMKRMAEIAQTSFNETAAIAAAQIILDRAYGKANQTNINASVDANGKETDISQKELDTRINQALKRVEAITGRTPEAPKGEERPVDLREHDRDPDSSSLH